jgi:adenylylsulfate kinase-like enzyme
MSKGITVKIIAGPAAGKTTLAAAFRDFLHKQGFTNVAVKDEDIALGLEHANLQDEKMDAIRHRPVLIETVQTRKGVVE